MKIEQKAALMLVGVILFAAGWELGDRHGNRPIRPAQVWLCGTINGQQLEPIELSGTGLLIRSGTPESDKPNIELHICSPAERRAGMSREE